MTLSVIGSGFGRTGTRSIKIALEHLGLGPCHHMDEVFKDPTQLPKWLAAAEGEQVDWHDVFAGYRSAVDWPSTNFWRELAEVFPNSKIILSVRPADRWWTSFSGTIKRLIEIRSNVPDAYVRSVLDMAHKLIAEQTFGGAMNDKSVVLSAYQKRIDEVRQTIQADRLLVFDVAEGWAPLCEFLNLPKPDTDFPQGNSREEFWKDFGGGYSPV